MRKSSNNSSSNNCFAIDLLWVRVGKVGGSESFVRNLLDGMQESGKDFEAHLLLACDNYESFEKYGSDDRFHLSICPVHSENAKERVIWQNMHLTQKIKKLNISKCLEPIYNMPFIYTKGVDYYTVIHDLQAEHYPQYFSSIRRMWLRLSWKNSLSRAKRIITISDDAKKDIVELLHANPDKVVRIYNPVSLMTIPQEEAENLTRSCGVEPGEFFFCVSSLVPHKNIQTIIDVMKKRNDEIKLIICGVGGCLRESFIEDISKQGLSEKVVVAGFIDNRTRDSLYATCKAFLFPSVFEGFGMPPVESLLADKITITTNCTSIPEVTNGEAVYVSNPYDVAEWNRCIDEALDGKYDIPIEQRTISSHVNPYTRLNTADSYLAILEGC